MGSAEDRPDDKQADPPARTPAKKVTPAKKAGGAKQEPPAKKAAGSGATKKPAGKSAAKAGPAADAPAKKPAATKSPAKKAPAKKSTAKKAPAKAAPAKAAPAPEPVVDAAPQAAEPAEPRTAPEPEPAAAPEKRPRRSGRFRRQDLDAISPPTTSPIPKIPSRDPRRLQQRVAVIIPAKDEARRIAATVRSAKSIPQVDLVLVVDDGSQDATQHVARDAGAVVVRHSHNRGKAAAMETGAAVVAMRDAPERPPRLLLFIDADLGETAVNTAPLIPPVAEHAADFSIALLPPQVGAGGRGIVVTAARRGIARLTGWAPTQPLSGMRCLTREAFEAATPLARGWGVETGMTIDLLRQGFVAVEVPCDLRHRPSGNDLGGQLHRAAQYRDVQLALNARRVRSAAGAVRRAVAGQPGPSS